MTTTYATTTTTTSPLFQPFPCTSNPDLWFAEHDRHAQLAKSACAPCPVREQCLRDALERREPAGVWGGEVLVEGVVVAVKRGRGRPRRTVVPAA